MLTLNQRYQIAQYVRITGCSVAAAAEKFNVGRETAAAACREFGVEVSE